MVPLYETPENEITCGGALRGLGGVGVSGPRHA